MRLLSLFKAVGTTVGKVENRFVVLVLVQSIFWFLVESGLIYFARFCYVDCLKYQATITCVSQGRGT